MCVFQTAIDLLKSYITPYVLVDGVSSCNSQEISVALETIRQAGGVVTTSESILFQLVGKRSCSPYFRSGKGLLILIQGDASSSDFKPFAALIKEEKAQTTNALSALLDSTTPSSKSSL